MRNKFFILILILAAFVGSYFILPWVTAPKPDAPSEQAFFPEFAVPPETANITFTNRNGETYTFPAYEGLVKVLTRDGVTGREMKFMATELGAEKIIGQIPSAGIYLIQVKPGYESEFISVMLSRTPVADAYPAFRLSLQSLVIIDNFQDKKYHGQAVEYYASGKQKISSDAELNNCLKIKRCVQHTWFGPAQSIYHALTDWKKANDPYHLFNISLGPNSEDQNGKKISSDIIGMMNVKLLKEYLAVLKDKKNKEEAGKSVLILSSGNENLNLDNALNDLTSENQLTGGKTEAEENRQALNRIILVGALNEKGSEIAGYSNYSAGNQQNIIYVPVDGKVEGMEEKMFGTSFAAPQVAYLVDKILEKYPQLAKEPEKIKNILFSSEVSENDETFIKKERSVYRFIKNPYSLNTLSNALDTARKQLGLPVMPEDRIFISVPAEINGGVCALVFDRCLLKDCAGIESSVAGKCASACLARGYKDAEEAQKCQKGLSAPPLPPGPGIE